MFEGNLGFEIDWASLIVGRTFTVFAVPIIYLYLEGRFN